MQQAIEMTFRPEGLSDDDLASIGAAFATLATGPDDVLTYLVGAVAGFVLKPEQERRAAGGEPMARVLSLTDIDLGDDELLRVMAAALKSRTDFLELGNLDAAGFMDAILSGFHDAYQQREAAAQVAYLEQLAKL